VPVFLVQGRAGEASAAPFDPPAARLLVPLDGSTFAKAALPTAIDVLGPAGELVLVHQFDQLQHITEAPEVVDSSAFVGSNYASIDRRIGRRRIR
jgi:hypothetical protein